MLIQNLIKKESITRKDIENELYEICDRVHGLCDSNCPVYKLNNYTVPDTANDFEKNRGCDCFKNGKAMYDFIALH